MDLIVLAITAIQENMMITEIPTNMEQIIVISVLILFAMQILYLIFKQYKKKRKEDKDAYR